MCQKQVWAQRIIETCHKDIDSHVLRGRDVDNGEDYACVGQGICGKSLNFFLNFSVNLEMLF